MSTESTFGTSDNTPIPEGPAGSTRPLSTRRPIAATCRPAQNALIEEFHT